MHVLVGFGLKIQEARGGNIQGRHDEQERSRRV